MPVQRNRKKFKVQLIIISSNLPATPPSTFLSSFSLLLFSPPFLYFLKRSELNIHFFSLPLDEL